MWWHVAIVVVAFPAAIKAAAGHSVQASATVTVVGHEEQIDNFELNIQAETTLNDIENALGARLSGTTTITTPPPRPQPPSPFCKPRTCARWGC